MNNYPLPSDDRLEQLIRDSFEFTPGPDMVRLKQLEQRLTRSATGVRPRPKLNTLPWWVFLLLAGGFATAAWWVGEAVLRKDISDVGISDKIENRINETPVNTSEPVQTDDPAESRVHEDKDSPVIYQRENL